MRRARGENVEMSAPARGVARAPAETMGYARDFLGEIAHSRARSKPIYELLGYWCIH